MIKDEHIFEKCNFKIIQRCISTRGSNTRRTCRKAAKRTWYCFFIVKQNDGGYGIWTGDAERHRRERSRKRRTNSNKIRSQGATARTSSSQRTTTGWWWVIWYGCKNKIGVRRKMRERIQGDWKFKQLQHKDDHGQHHTTHWDEDKGNLFI